MHAHVSSVPIENYVSELLTFREAMTRFNMKESTFLHFRKRHKIPRLSGGKVHAHDIIRAFERERGLSPKPSTTKSNV